MPSTTRNAWIGAALGAAAVAAALSSGAAQGAPVGVAQLPANGIAVNGITDFRLASAAIRVDTAGPGGVWFSAPAGGQCGNPAVDDSFVRFDYTNVSTGRSGSALVRPCPGPWSGSPRVKLTTGGGVVVGMVSIVSRGGPWSLPGGATFTVG